MYAETTASVRTRARRLTAATRGGFVVRIDMTLLVEVTAPK